MRNLYNLPDTCKTYKDSQESLDDPIDVFACSECHCCEVIIQANGFIQCADEDCEMLIGNLAQLLGVVLKGDGE